MSKIKGISHIVLYVNDLDKMVAFYRDVLGLVKYRENAGRMVFLTPDPELDDHQIALAKGREGSAKLIGHIAWKVDTPADVKEYYDKLKALGVPIDHSRQPRLRRNGQHRVLLFSRSGRQSAGNLMPW